jgi:ankyrin repeat protein
MRCFIISAAMGSPFTVMVVSCFPFAGADPEVVDGWGSTPLIEALFCGRLGIAELLIAKGARVKDNNFAAVKDAAEQDQAKLAIMCSKAGASANSVDYDHRSVLHTLCAAGNLKAVEGLLTAGANVNSRDRYVPGREN